METLAVIPARGGSKGVVRKNVLPLAGKPLIAHTIDTAKKSKRIDRLVVSTDDPEIGEISKDHGADIVWRPAELSGDEASSESALLNTLEQLENSENYQSELLVFLQCTSPLTVVEDIDGTVEKMLEKDADSAFTVTPFHSFIWQDAEGGELAGVNHDKNERLRRQDREQQYRETGAVFVFDTEGFLEAEHRFFGKMSVYEVPRKRSFEIDDPIDFSIAETLLYERSKEREKDLIPDPLELVVLDFDGVFTGNEVIVAENGLESVICNRSDGYGISQLKKNNIRTIVLSKEKNPVVQRRCEKLELECFSGVDNKLDWLNSFTAENQVDLNKTLYVGNDINDLSSIQRVGCGVAVTDSQQEVVAAADIVLESKGGDGAIREVCDLILDV